MGRTAPWQARHEAGVARDRRWRVDEMGIKPAAVRRQFRSEHGGLTEAAKTVRAEVSRQVGKPCPKRRSEARPASRPDKAADDPQRRLVEIFRQIDDGCRDFAMNRMRNAVRRITHRKDT